jgi:hypothetical protein
MDILNIEFTDKSKHYLSVPYRSYNVETCLNLPGNKTIEYGYDINTNLLHLLEHFANNTPPARSVQGQLWFNSESNKLLVNTTGEDSSYLEVGYMKPHPTPAGTLSIEQVKARLRGYLTTDGGLVTGPLLLKDYDEADHIHSAVSKGYVDSLVPNNPNNYIPLSGNPTAATGPILINPIDEYSTTVPSSVAATKKYADDMVPQINIKRETTIMNGELIAGYMSSAILKPSNLIYIFGVVTIQKEETERTVELLPNFSDSGFTRIKGVSLHVNTTGVLNNNVTVDGRISGTSMIIRKHGVGTAATSVYFNICGVLK